MSNESFLDFFKPVEMEDKTKEKITNLLENEGWTLKDLLCFGSLNETIDVFKPTLERAEAAKIWTAISKWKAIEYKPSNFTTNALLTDDKQVLETEIEDIEDDESDGTSEDQPEHQNNDENENSSNFGTIKMERKNFLDFCHGGSVYRGYLGDREFAVKYCVDSRYFAQVRNEAEILRFLNSKQCAHVPKYCHSYLNESDREAAYYLIRDFIDGKRLCFDKESISIPQHRKDQCLNALSAIHKFGVLHGDLSEKSFLATDDEVFIIDFEFSRITERKSMFKDEFYQLKELLGLSLLE